MIQSIILSSESSVWQGTKEKEATGVFIVSK